MAALQRRRTAALAVAAAVVLALALRFVALGDRTVHVDEARVGYWTLQYAATGEWAYDAALHGPFLFHVNEALFGVLGATDAVARAPVALVGGLLPATAWLFRARLDDVEVGAVAALLALNPVLVYYSRFARSDVLVAACSLAALGFAVRALDTRRGGHLVAAGVALALAFTAKENAVVYVGLFAGATALLLDERLFTARERSETWVSVLHDDLQAVAGGVLAWRRALAGAAAAFLLVVVAFYAPRPEVYAALGDPTELPDVLGAATTGAWSELWGTWGIGGTAPREHSYVAFLVDALRTVSAASLLLAAAAAVGFLAERYVADDPRDLVLFASYWAVASLVVYPVISVVSGHWTVVHVVVPAAIPAAVGVRLVVERGRTAYASGDRVGVALAAIVLLAAVGQVGAVAAETSYASPQDADNPLVHHDQPASDLRSALDGIESVAAEHDGSADVLYFGCQFRVSETPGGPCELDDSGDEHPATAADVGGNWHNRLPLPWYFARADVETNSTASLTALQTTDSPVVVTRVRASSGPESSDSHSYLEYARVLSERGYEDWAYELRATNAVVVVFVNADAPGYEPLE